MQQLRRNYQQWLDLVDIRNLIFVDEAGINLAMTRLYARAPRGLRVFDAIPYNDGDNISLVGAFSLDGLIAAMPTRGSINTPAFITFLKKVLVP